MAGPGLVIVSLRRSTTCVGTPDWLPDPRIQRAPCRWAAARASPRSMAGQRPVPHPDPSGEGYRERRDFTDLGYG